MIIHIDGSITMSEKEFDDMHKQLAFLDCLRAVGVDNWSGYADAQEMFDDIAKEINNNE